MAVPAAMTDSILNAWRAQGTFIRFLDGNTLNCAVANLVYVSLADAMAHVDGNDVWKVDWDMNLTEEQRRVVMDPNWRAGLNFG
jgi:hypothetical protein